MTLFEVPHRSFGAEIIKDYQERTLLFSWRELITWVAAIGNAFMGYFIFFRSTPSYPYGQLNPEVWFPFALAGGVFMAAGMLYSSLATTKYIKDLSQWSGSTSIKDIIKEISIAITNKSFLIFFAGNLTLSIAWGLSNSLALYINTDFWGLSGNLITIFLAIYITSTLMAFYLTPRLVKRLDKKNLVLMCIFGTAFFSPIAFISYNLGLTPERGTLSLIFFLSIPLVFISCFSVMGNMTRDSMIGDIADEVELTSGKRQEGVLYSAVSFIQKVNTAIGGFVAGLVLKIIDYPKDDPTYEQTYSLFFVQGVVGPILLALPLFIFFFYKLDRNRHEIIIAELEASK
jgi:Na+/melibiose symporter-like transporter